MLLAASMVARAFDFSHVAPSGQTIYYDIYGSTVKVVNPDWDYHVKPSGALVLPATVEHNGNTYSVTAIGASAFEDCTGLTRVSVPEGVTSIEGFAFYNCSALDTIELPSTLTEILSQAFTYTGYVRNAANRDEQGLLYIGAYLISGADIAEVTVADGTLGVAGMAFYYNHTITKVTLPETMRFLAGLSFADCTSLDTVRCLSAVPPAAVGNAFSESPSFVVAVPCGAADAYSAADVWRDYTIVEDGCDTTMDVVENDLQPRVNVARVYGGTVVSGAEGSTITVCDVMGRTVASVGRASAAQFLYLPQTGVYMLSVAGRKPIKIFYSK